MRSDGDGETSRNVSIEFQYSLEAVDPRSKGAYWEGYGTQRTGVIWGQLLDLASSRMLWKSYCIIKALLCLVWNTGVLHKQQAEKQIHLINYFSTAYYIPHYSSGIVLKTFPTFLNRYHFH